MSNVQNEQNQIQNTTNTASTANFLNSNSTNILLATALIKAEGPHGHSLTLRALIDSGSQVSFITKQAAKKLKLKQKTTDIKVTGLEKTNTAHVYKRTLLKIFSLHNNYSFNVNALVVNQITDYTPTQPVDISHISYIKNLNLADPQFFEPGPIDLLLGADVYSSIIEMGLIKGNDDTPSAQATQLGWILMGPISLCNHSQKEVSSFFTSVSKITFEDLDQTLKKFWEIEEVNKSPPLSPDEQLCEEIYKKTVSRLSNGSYEVSLPFKENKQPQLGQSKHIAVKQFFQLEKKFQQKPEFFKMYKECIDEYIQLGHMKEVTSVDNSDEINHYYLPHHAVMKESTTTKLRVVFNASSKTSNGKSLNEQLLTGPTIQPTLWCTLLNWRQHKFALTADIEKMYRMIHIKLSQQDYQRIVWRSNPNEKLKDFALTTVTFGTAPAPFLAIRTLFQLAEDEKDNFPLAAKCLTANSYVDDLLCGADTISEALKLQSELLNMLKKGGFNLRKWTANHIDLLKNIPMENREIKNELEISESESFKTLGIKWFPSSDNFSFSVSLPPAQQFYTKRSVLSEVASLFDPLGWLAPVIIVAKILIQKLWLLGCEWDKKLPETVQAEWLEFRNQLNSIENIRIPRWTHFSKDAQLEIHGFSDASNQAYAAVVYLKVITNNQIFISLLTSKTRVAPTKPVTLPRLELCGSLLLSRILNQVQEDLKLKHIRSYAWTDSLITLSWIKGQASKWKTYVANRVAEIQEKIPPSHWYHVPGDQNPADCASRGILPKELQNHQLWWKGPPWLSQEQEKWPSQPTTPNTELEIKKVKTFLTTQEPDFITKFSSFSKLRRVTAYCLRFIQNCKKSNRKVKKNYLTSIELQYAEQKIIQVIQQHSFSAEIQNLKKNKPISSKSSILSLNPFLDKDSILRVGGRLEHANIPYEAKHPVILPKNHFISKLIIDYLHKITLHGGCQLILNTLRTKYWLPNAKNTIKERIHKCIQCFKTKPKLSSQIMAPLPAYRTNITYPFSNSGVDFAGPFPYKTSKMRSSKILKCYICLFICMSTKAIHLELCTELSASAFIAVFKRFVSRRGQCKNLYSDCGTNFIGASRKLDAELQRALKENTEEIAKLLAEQNTIWHFNPPSAPHFGGIWEAGVKSVKTHLKRLLQNTVFSFEEFQTLLCQVEACVNSRPLTPLSDNADDLSCLTPGHFLIGRHLLAVPEAEIDENKSVLTHWQQIQKILQQFWKRWSEEYLHTLQQRQKWNVEQPNLRINDVVLIKDERYPPTRWPIGRIIKIHPGSDGKVRVVSIKTENSELVRPISKLCKLPISNSYREPA